MEGMKTILSSNIHVIIFLFTVIDEMSGCLKPKLGQKLVASDQIRQVLAWFIYM